MSEGVAVTTMANAPLASVALDSFHEISGIHPSRVEPSRHFFEYGVDFVLLVDLVVLLEERLGIDIPNEVLDDLKCMDDVVRYLRRRANRNRSTRDAVGLCGYETPHGHPRAPLHLRSPRPFPPSKVSHPRARRRPAA